MIKICESCGKKFDASKDFYKLCPSCHRSGTHSGRGRAGPAQRTVPSECVFKTFFGEEGYPKREIYIESAVKMSEILEREDMKMSQIRNLFHMLKSASRILKADPHAEFGEARKTFCEFVRQVDYQYKRERIPPVFVEFVRQHVDIATKDPNEFFGFVEYFTSILARIKQR